MEKTQKRIWCEEWYDKLENASLHQCQEKINEDGSSRLLLELSFSKDRKKMVSNHDSNLGRVK